MYNGPRQPSQVLATHGQNTHIGLSKKWGPLLDAISEIAKAATREYAKHSYNLYLTARGW